MPSDPEFHPERPDWPGLRQTGGPHIHADLPALIAYAPVGPLWLPAVPPDGNPHSVRLLREAQAVLLEAGIPVTAFAAVIGFQPEGAHIVDPAALRGLRAACVGLILLDLHRDEAAHRAWCDALSFTYRSAPIHWVKR